MLSYARGVKLEWRIKYLEFMCEVFTVLVF